MGVFSHIYKRPRLNQSWYDGKIVTHHEEETWLQLFIDLIFVAFFMTLGKGIAYCETYENEKEADVLGAAGLLFLLLFSLRYDIDMYANRFHSRDLVTRILYFIFTCGVVIMSLHIYKTNSSNACPYLGLQAKAELVGFILAYASIVALNGIAIYKNPRTQPQLGLEYFFSLLYLFFALVIVVPIPNDYLINFFRVTVPLNYLFRTEFLGQFIRPSFNKYLGPYLFVKDHGPLDMQREIIPLNIHVHQVRLCMFVMIATGEGMIQIIYPSLPSDLSYVDRIYMFVISCVVILFSLAMLYADAVVRDPHHSDHAMKRDGKIAGVIWTFSHAILGYFMFLTGIAIELAIALVYQNKPIDHSYDTLLGVCIGSATLTMTLMRSTHKGIHYLFCVITYMIFTIFFDCVRATAGLTNEEKQDETVAWNKGLRRKINYTFRILVCLLHYLFAYLEFIAEDGDSDDTTSTDTSFEGSTTGTSDFSAAAAASNDDTTNYHDVRQQDRFFYLHAALLAFSLLSEVAASFLCKKKDRSSAALTMSSRDLDMPIPTSSMTPTFDHSNPLHDSDDKVDDEKL